MEKKTTKHTVGNVYRFLNEYLLEHKGENLTVSGIEFSNLGARGREPLFDVSYDQKGTIMAYWKDDSKSCVEISAPEPGYEVKAPKSLRQYFWKCDLRYLNVSHLDVSDTTDFSFCFLEFGGNYLTGSRHSEIIGLETWDVQKGKDFTGMFEKCLSLNKAISLNLSSWRFSTEESISFLSINNRQRTTDIFAS